ncbi:hypothetical protein B0O80DRAFT_445665 [Mortierella sp. GBAus27b]|nr:hypothetical protein BGX31_004761 [Mortierella sp. GBA43]KAI8357717.1 hypothetical protein B0O80DRAFT_445665 [Mortierella sp. GBAus27b]
MSSSASIALQIPEILQEIARRVPLFEYGYQMLPEFRHDTQFIRNDFEDAYVPHHISHCLLVSRFWNECFTPHLYHYYIHQDNISLQKDENKRQAYQRHGHLVRRIATYNSYHQKIPLYIPNIQPGKLEGLFLYGSSEDSEELLLHHQGPNLKQLLWVGHNPFEAPKLFQEAWMNLSYLEELTLSECTMSNQQFYRILSQCTGTLRKLNLRALDGIDQGVFELHNGGSDSHSSSNNGSSSTLSFNLTGKPSWTVPHVKFLSMEPTSIDLEMTALLPRLFPAIESVFLVIKDDVDHIPGLTSTLREHCTNLRSIGYGPASWDNFDSAWLPAPEVYAALCKDSFSTPQLECASVLLSWKLDNHLIEALLFHAPTLVKLELRYHRLIRTDEDVGMDKVANILSKCMGLKDVRLLQLWRELGSIERLLEKPWGCHGLETLIIGGYLSSENVDDRTPKYDTLKPRRCQYNDAGQGWFLKPGLTAGTFYRAIADGNLKRRVLEHMYESGVEKAKYVKLNDTEFFARERLPTSPEALKDEFDFTYPEYLRYREQRVGIRGRVYRLTSSIGRMFAAYP